MRKRERKKKKKKSDIELRDEVTEKIERDKKNKEGGRQRNTIYYVLLCGLQKKSESFAKENGCKVKQCSWW